MTAFFESNTADEVWRLAAIELLNSFKGCSQKSRLGPVTEILHSNLHILEPRQRWINSRIPALNPAFAIAEVVWIMQGRNDSDFINFWNPVLPKFCGEDSEYHGAYGYRLRRNIGIDQIERAYQVLSKNPDTRQVVLQIWDGKIDLPAENATPASKDIPCNICSMLNIRNGRLEWTQIMRSNDLFLGTPHNFVQFTSLQEILAGWLGLEVGSYYQMSNSLHAYLDDLEKYQISDQTKPLINTDSLALSKEVTQKAFQLIEEIMERLRASDLGREEFSSLLETNKLPEGYYNMLLVVAADSARRRQWTEHSIDAISKCTNECLVHAWEQWEKRVTLPSY
ncbi:thymidylate synthase [Marinobacterium arenosum]|uniref:thymidylate synthase n=1 Tax=Marinobacterium arenosum TaxID=2862496 RepID=UPI001C962850|nr:thymidylate synthase [Marinobacterium arenosum]MBY4678087.1 thymidylate synthase [Marinobacterium arenosum]